MEALAASCPACNAPRVAGPECPGCGVIYAKADARRAARAVAAEEALPLADPSPADAGILRPVTPTWDGEQDELTLELRIKTWALPAALVFAWLMVSTGPGHFLARTFFSMWLHELGHATTAWLCSLPAFPGPWFTRVAEERSFMTGLLVVAGLTAWALYALRARNHFQVALASTGVALFVVGTFLTPLSRAQTWMIFGGDGGALVLGVLAIASMNASAESKLRTGHLRWGFLLIGALTVADVSSTWFAAYRDVGEIPFGMSEGVGLSDSSKLVDQFGWTERQLVNRYLGLAIAALLTIAVSHAYGIHQARRDLEAHRG